MRDHLSEAEAALLPYLWHFWARPNQKAPPGDWHTWLLLAGRGFGKTRTGAEWIRAKAESGNSRRIAIVGETAADNRDILIEGDAGILTISPPWFRPDYEPSKRRLTWPNGCIVTTYSGDEPDQLRGPQHDAALADELCKWKYPQEAWDNLELGLRVGQNPQVVVATTPKPLKILRDILADPMTVTTRGSSYDNLHNLAPAFIRRVISRYEGTRLGRQEVHAEILDEAEGALWNHAMIEALRVRREPDLFRIVVGIDPAATANEDSDETGIIVAGCTEDGRGYVLADLSLRASPGEWAKAAVAAYYRYRADRICAEVNNGGDMVEFTIQTVDPNVPVTKLHASRGKYARAEPIAALYEQNRVHHVSNFADLEDQMCNWAPGDPNSPDRMDAMVWCFTELLLEGYRGPLGVINLADAAQDDHEALPMLDREEVWT